MTEQWNKYDKTAARRHGKPGRQLRPQSVTIDIHAHIGDAPGCGFRRAVSRSVNHPARPFRDAETKTMSQDHERIRAPAGADRRLADLDAMGIDRPLIAPPPPQCYYTVPLDIAVRRRE